MVAITVDHLTQGAEGHRFKEGATAHKTVTLTLSHAPPSCDLAASVVKAALVLAVLGTNQEGLVFDFAGQHDDRASVDVSTLRDQPASNLIRSLYRASDRQGSLPEWTGTVQGHKLGKTVLSGELTVSLQQKQLPPNALVKLSVPSDAPAIDQRLEKAWYLLLQQRQQPSTVHHVLEALKSDSGQSAGEQNTVVVVPPFSLLPQTLQSKSAVAAVLTQHGIAADHLEDVYPATPMQLGMVIKTIQKPTMYVEQVAYLLRGPFDERAFRDAYGQTIAINTALRTRFVQTDAAGMLAVVDAKPECLWTTANICEARLQADLAAYMREDQERSFALGELYARVAILSANPTTHIFLLTVHHAVADAVSQGIFMWDLMSFYTNIVLKRTALPPHRSQYQLFVRHLQSVDWTATHDFWRKNLAAATVTPYPPRPDEQEGYHATCTTTADVTLDKKRFKAESGSTLAMLFHLCYAYLLGHYTETEDVLFGTVVATRRVPNVDMQTIVGLCINTLPLRVPLHAMRDRSVLDTLADLRKGFGQMLKHSLINGRDIQDAVADDGGVRMFRSMVNYRGPRLELAKVDGQPVEFTLHKYQHDMDIGVAISVDETAGGLRLEAEYDPSCLTADQADMLLRHLKNAIENAAQSLSQCWTADWFMDSAEKKRLQQGITSGDTVPTPEHRLLHELFETSVARTPDAVAVDYEGSEQLTYAQLNARANRLAHMLRDRYHVGPEVMVPLCVDKSVDMVVAILAVLKAGGAYVPLDPKHPAERLKYIVGNVDATVVLAHAQHAHLFDGVHVVVLDSSLDLTGCSDSNPVVADVQSSSLAYVIYTSGSTGQPKGVMIEHGDERGAHA
ncbi:hypothetical protein RI367_003519 [Sorochytrium milnesiophthora]